MSLQVHACRSLTNPSASATRYIAPINGQLWTATEGDATVIGTAAGTFSNFSVVLPSAPGASKSLTFTLRKNGVDTAAVVAISGTATSGTYTATAIAMADGDELSIKCVPSGTPAVSTPSICWDFDSTTPGESIYGYAFAAGGILQSNSTQRVLCPSDTNTWSANATVQEVVGCAGAITKATIKLDVDVGASGTITFTITKNGVAQNGAGGTPDTRITFATGTTKASATFTLPISPGDVLTWTATETGSIIGVRPKTGVRILATTLGHSHFGGTYHQSVAAAGGTLYHVPGQGSGGTAASATESARAVTLGLTGLILRNLRVQLSTGAGSTGALGWTLALRKNSADAGNSVTILGVGATTGSNTSLTTYAAGDTVALQTVPVGAANSPGPGWAWVQDQSALEFVLVPNVVGDLQAAAVVAITGAGLIVGTITSAASVTVPAGHVISQTPVGGTSVLPGSAVDLVVAAVVPGFVVLINGAPWRFRAGSMSIHSTLNGRDTLSGILDILDDADPPTLNQTVVVEEDGDRIFGGRINELEYRAITSDPDASKDLMVSLSAQDFNAIADNRTIASLTLPEGSTLKQALVLLVAELAPYGVTLSATQVDGPVLPSLNFRLQTATVILDELSKLTEFVWEIDYYQVLSMWQPGSVAAPFNITDGDGKVWGDIVIRPIASDYANRIIVRGPGNGPSENVFAWYTDGTTNNFQMYMFVLQHFGQVLVDTPLETVPGEGYESVGATGSGALWEFHDGPRYTQYLSRAAGAPPAGNPWGVVPYPLQFRVIQEQPIVVTADDLAEQAANGIVEKLVESPNGAAWWELQALADALLIQHASRRYTVQFSTQEAGVRVGQSITISIARRNLDGPYFITDVETRMVGATILKRTVTANETELFQGSWRDTYKSWSGNSGGGSGGGSTTVGTTIPVGGTPVPHHVQHEPGGMDAMTVDSTAAIGSLRTLGTGANQAAPGNALASYLLLADVDLIIRSGTRASQPAATAVLAGTLYCLTDERNAVERSTGTVWESFVRRRHVAIFAYDYSSTTTAPPVSTTVRFNAAAPYTTVTKVYVHVQTNDGRDVYLGLMGTDTGARVTIQDKNDHTVYATFTVTGTPVDHTTYIEWPVVYVANGGASLFNNQAVLVMKQ